MWRNYKKSCRRKANNNKQKNLNENGSEIENHERINNQNFLENSL
jgi:hypothetical protein